VSDRKTPAHITGGAASLGGETSPCAAPTRAALIWTVLAWAALLVTIAVSFRPAVPVVWGDTPPFVESALLTLEAGKPTVAGGRDPGYPAFLAATFAFGGDLATVVRVQQVAWALLMLVLAATAQAVTRSGVALVPIILVAMYPGLLLFRNVLTAELLFAVILNLAVAGLLVATCAGKTARCWTVAVSVLCAALAACFKSQAFLVPIAVLTGLGLARPDTAARRAVIAVSVAAALALIAAGSRFGASNSDQASVVFVSKTLFCNHLNIVLASDAARREITSAAGDRADAVMTRLATDVAAEPERWPVLGFFGDVCLFDTALDHDVAGDTAIAGGAAATYRRIFLAAIRDRPLSYATKFVRQMAYGALIAWPPYGLEPVIPVSSDDVPHVNEIMTRHGRLAQSIDLKGEPVRIGLLSDFPAFSTYLFGALSIAFVVSLMFWTLAAVRRRRHGFVKRAGIVIAIWAASIATAAAAHTLDVWRYLIPAVPMVGLMLSLFAAEMAETIAGTRRS